MKPAPERSSGWSLSPYPDGRDFAFTLVHDADSAYSARLDPLFRVFDALGLRITATAFTFWAEWAEDGRIWSQWRGIRDEAERYFAPVAVPLQEKTEEMFYKSLSSRGHEIGMHSPSETSDTRERVIRAFRRFKEIFGAYPRVYVEHSAQNNKDAQANEGSDPKSAYYNTDLLNRYGPWVWVDGPESLPARSEEKFYDVLASRGSPFNRSASKKYGLEKAFIRTGKWRKADGDGFLECYTEANFDRLEEEGGLALVYTHLDDKWLDPETRRMRKPIRDRLSYLASKNGWFAPAGEILDRFHAIERVRVSAEGRRTRVVNGGGSELRGLTLVSRSGEKKILAPLGPSRAASIP